MPHRGPFGTITRDIAIATLIGGDAPGETVGEIGACL
jgi:hypothetical protein